MDCNADYIVTLRLIYDIKRVFEVELERRLNLVKVPSPLFVNEKSGLQDNLTGIEKSISFNKGDETFEIVHSLAKWKRDALGRYNFPINYGLYTNMKAIRKDEEVDDIHSLYVEQWDWEKIISKENRTIEYLKKTVGNIYSAILYTYGYISPKLDGNNFLSRQVTFITSQELEDMYPMYTPSEREYLITKEFGTVFIIGIGNRLKSGKPHDLRSPDYDDWNLNGDLLIFDNKFDRVVEVSSMGIRVDENSLLTQLKESNCLNRLEFTYHRKVLNRELPYTIGGGIGESRLILLLLGREHIAEIQASSWEEKTLKLLKNKKVL